jgi:superfamily II DNA or RNA helicase
MTKKDQIQQQAVEAINASGGKAILTLATGVGKSKVGIMYLEQKEKLHKGTKTKKPLSVALVVPTESLRDNNWKEEFQKWGKSHLYENIDRYCYASIGKVTNKQYDVVILDECHNITLLSATFFENNSCNDIIALTATLPSSEEKTDILFNKLELKVAYSVSLDEAVELELVCPFEINIIYTELNNVNKTIASGSAINRFYVTEKQSYFYLSKSIENLSNGSRKKMLSLERMRLLRNANSKIILGKQLLEHHKKERSLFFCGSIDAAIKVCDRRFYSKPSITAKTRPERKQMVEDQIAVWEGKKGLEDFADKKINALSCVESLNEGQNIPDVDNGIILSFNSKELDTIQRIGRIIRYKAGKKGNIVIGVIKDSKEEDWIKEALKNFDSSIKINTYANFEQYQSRNH